MLRALERVEEGACVLLLAVMTAVAFANVVTRYVVRYSLAFTEEVVVNLFVWLTLFGTAIAFREGMHLGFDYLVARAPGPVQRAAIWLGAALSFALFAALIRYGVGQIATERALGATTEALAIPQWWYTAGVPVVSLLVLVRVVQGAVRADWRLRDDG